MPFVQRVVTPKYVARSTKPSHSRGTAALPVQDYELEAITNLTLSNALRQLASLVLISNQIFTELNKELASVSERSLGIKQRIDNLSKRVEEFDPKQVAVRKYPSFLTYHSSTFQGLSHSRKLLFPLCASVFCRYEAVVQRCSKDWRNHRSSSILMKSDTARFFVCTCHFYQPCKTKNRDIKYESKSSFRNGLYYFIFFFN